ncbi:MAG: hypothetical protein ACI8RZ_000215 [Myxococcota bacterium]|jgi:hypothetical protein
MERATHTFFLIPLLSLSLLGCTEPTPTDLAGCAALSAPTAREECRFSMVAPLAGDSAAFKAALAEIEEPYSRDLIRYRLAFQDPEKNSGLCREVEETTLHEKCRQIIGRPHLSSTRKKP